MKRKDHNDIARIISDVMMGRLSEADRPIWEAWISDAAHRRQYEDMLRRTDLTHRYRQYEHVDLSRAWRRFETTHALRPHRRWQRWVAAASVVALGVIVWWQTGYHRKEHRTAWPALTMQQAETIARAEQSGATEATFSISGRAVVVARSGDELAECAYESGDMGTVVTCHDKEFWLTLPDGTRVHLNYATSLTYPMAFEDHQRSVTLDGEAYFIVAKDAGRPFIVKTRDGIVTDYGTEFVVNTRDKAMVQTLLVKGDVGVCPTSGSERRIVPGEMATMHKGSDRVEVRQVDVDPYIAWNTGRFSFDACPLDDLMAVIAKWYGCEVVFADESWRKIRFTGVLGRYEDMYATLDAIGTVTGLKLRCRDKRIVIGK